MQAKRIAYFVHNVNDAAVARRVEMFNAGGAITTVLGFRRDGRIPAQVAGAPVVDLGRTYDSKLAQRAWMVVVNLLWPMRLLQSTRGSNVIIGRNLESLALAWRARRANARASLVYECLDIHRSLVGQTLASRAVRKIEEFLLQRINLLIVSAPAFLSEYFDKRSALSAPTLLVENKLLRVEGPPPEVNAPPLGPPWIVGWFGNLRCNRTLRLLLKLADALDGKLKVLIAGQASPAEFDDFPREVAASPYCRYVGPFSSADIPSLYGQCHFAWAIDFFEEGLNSRWLLPNRLYEASSCGAVPICLRSVATGRWLEQHSAGVLLDEASSPFDQLRAFFEKLNRNQYNMLHREVASIPRSDLIADRGDCISLTDTVTRLTAA